MSRARIPANGKLRGSAWAAVASRRHMKHCAPLRRDCVHGAPTNLVALRQVAMLKDEGFIYTYLAKEEMHLKVEIPPRPRRLARLKLPCWCGRSPRCHHRFRTCTRIFMRVALRMKHLMFYIQPDPRSQSCSLV